MDSGPYCNKHLITQDGIVLLGKIKSSPGPRNAK